MAGDLKIAGHTMATPGMSAFEAMELFAGLRLAGMEIAAMRRQEAARSYQRAGYDPEAMLAGEDEPFSIDWPADLRKALREKSCGLIPVITVTPYVRALNHPDERLRSSVVGQMEAYIDLARDVGARYVRVYGGEERREPEAMRLLIDSLGRLADYASQRGVILLLENHPGTMTVTGRATAEVVAAVGSDSLRVLYDPANVMAHSDERPEVTFRLQEGLIEYVHVKDLVITPSGRKSCLLGAGSVPWKDILRWLAASGFSGWFSLEYEKKWSPRDLPDAREGLPVCREFLLKNWPA